MLRKPTKDEVSERVIKVLHSKTSQRGTMCATSLKQRPNCCCSQMCSSNVAWMERGRRTAHVPLSLPVSAISVHPYVSGCIRRAAPAASKLNGELRLRTMLAAVNHVYFTHRLETFVICNSFACTASWLCLCLRVCRFVPIRNLLHVVQLIRSTSPCRRGSSTAGLRTCGQQVFVA